MKVGIYGGTFSPPHLGHVRAAAHFMKERSLDELHIIPALVPPHKMADGSATAEQRMDMCKLAFGHLPHVTISDRELRRGGRSYSVLTLREYAAMGIHPDMLMGTDMFLCLEQWYCFREIFMLCTVVCMRRETDPEQEEALQRAADRYRSLYGADIAFLSGHVTEISSSDIRAAAKAGLMSAYLSKGVEKYIRAGGLYGCQ